MTYFAIMFWSERLGKFVTNPSLIFRTGSVAWRLKNDQEIVQMWTEEQLEKEFGKDWKEGTSWGRES